MRLPSVSGEKQRRRNATKETATHSARYTPAGQASVMVSTRPRDPARGVRSPRLAEQRSKKEGAQPRSIKVEVKKQLATAA